MSTPLRLGILLSGRGRGSNMANLVAATRDGRLPEAEVVLVVSASRGAPALERARELGVPALLIPADEYETPEALDRALAEAFRRARVDLVCLAGYLRLLGAAFLDRFPDRVLNIHPALLPDFGGRGYYGLRVHQAVLESGAEKSGATVHVVDGEYDRGPIVLQEAVPVLPGDTPETLAARVLEAEHRLYPKAVRCYAEAAGLAGSQV